MKRCFLLFFILFFGESIQLMGQNLVPNPSFEAQDSCPTVRLHFISLAKDWVSPKGSADYFHLCADEYYQTPKNRYDTKKPHQGNAYAGIICGYNSNEYVMSQLITPLEKGATYKAKIHVSTSNHSNYASSDIGMYFTKNNYFGRGATKLNDVNPQIKNQKKEIIPTEKWTKISGEFIAEGGEKFIVIGGFQKEINLKNISGKETKSKYSYLFIDNVSLILLKGPKLELPLKGKTKILKTIYFEHNKYILNKASDKELTELTELLKDSNHVKIEILGHTDISGDEEYNITLAKQRAKAVGNYVVKKGISKERLKYQGFGSSIPFNPKNKKKNQAINRRVEFRVVD